MSSTELEKLREAADVYAQNVGGMGEIAAFHELTQTVEEFIEAARTAPAPADTPIAYVRSSELDKLKDQRIAGVGMMLHKEPGEGRVAVFLAAAPAPSMQGAVPEGYEPGQWWLTELENHWGHGVSSDDTKRAAKIACDFAAKVFAAAPQPPAQKFVETTDAEMSALIARSEARAKQPPAPQPASVPASQPVESAQEPDWYLFDMFGEDEVRIARKPYVIDEPGRYHSHLEDWKPVYFATHPVTWEALSDEQISDMAFGYAPSGKIGELREYARAIIAALKGQK